MAAISFTYCSGCGRKLKATFFCHVCGHPYCGLDCYCRHETEHGGVRESDRETFDAHSAVRCEPAVVLT